MTHLVFQDPNFFIYSPDLYYAKGYIFISVKPVRFQWPPLFQNLRAKILFGQGERKNEAGFTVSSQTNLLPCHRRSGFSYESDIKRNALLAICCNQG